MEKLQEESSLEGRGGRTRGTAGSPARGEEGAQRWPRRRCEKTVGLRHVLRVWRVVRYLRTVRKGWSAEKSSADSERREERGKKSGGRGEGVKRLR